MNCSKITLTLIIFGSCSLRRFILFTLIVSLSSISIDFYKILNLSVFEIEPYYNKDLPGGGLALDIILEAFTRSGWILNPKQ